jgi:small subunit ribosomal protein S6
MEERLYDLIFICMPTTPEEEIAKIVATLEHAAAEHGAKVEKLEKWGTRKLAYRVSKQREGYFVYLSLKSTQGDAIKELERRLKVSDAVIKYMTIRLDEELKRQQKLAAKREQRNRRRPRRTTGATPAPSAAPPAPPPPPATPSEPAPAAG